MQAHMRCPGAAPPSRGAEATPAACARDTSDGARRAVQPSVNAITKTSVADTAVGTAPRNRYPPRSASALPRAKNRFSTEDPLC